MCRGSRFLLPVYSGRPLGPEERLLQLPVETKPSTVDLLFEVMVVGRENRRYAGMWYDGVQGLERHRS